MTLDARQCEELHELIGALCDGAIDAERFARLQAGLADNIEAQRFYVRYLDLHGAIRRLSTSDQWPVVGGQWDEYPPSTIPPIIVDPTPTLHSPVGSFLVSHLAAAVILGIGLLIGLAWRISLPSSEGTGATGPTSASTVGRITALADCQGRQWSVASGQWSEITNHKLELINRKFSLGDRFFVSYGLMQITYDTGAKVILQGPCTYEIDSVRSGFLAVGKLTARIVAREHEAESLTTGHRPLATALFAVRTPTATVTDLGTEFGVEVEESGTTLSHVFQGSVEVRSSKGRRRAATGDFVEILHAGQSARVERGRNRVVVITREAGQPDRFVRHILSSLGHHPSSPAPRPTPQYRLTDLGSLGGQSSKAHAINALGQVVGEATTATGVTHAFVYTDGKMKDIGRLHDGISSAVGINSSGHVVVNSLDASSTWQHAFVFNNGELKNVGTLGGHRARAAGINDTGQIVGSSQSSDGVTRAFIHTQDAGMKDLGALGGATAESAAFSINNLGLVVGCSETKHGAHHAFLYHPAEGMQDLGTLGSATAYPLCVNDVGQVVGEASQSDVSRAFLYSRQTGMKSLVVFEGYNRFTLHINNHGQVVGSATDANDDRPVVHAFLFSNGKMKDLNSLLDPIDRWTSLMATAINDSGHIVGHGTAPDGNTRAFLLTPVKEGRGASDEGRGIH